MLFQKNDFQRLPQNCVVVIASCFNRSSISLLKSFAKVTLDQRAHLLVELCPGHSAHLKLAASPAAHPSFFARSDQSHPEAPVQISAQFL